MSRPRAIQTGHTAKKKEIQQLHCHGDISKSFFFVINCTYLQFQLPKEDSEENLNRLADQSTFDSESDKEDERGKPPGSYNVQRGSWRDLSIVSNLASITQDVKGFCLKQISKVK